MDDTTNLKSKSDQRLREIRKKYRKLCWTSGGCGAGGITKSTEFREYRTIVAICDSILIQRKSGLIKQTRRLNGDRLCRIHP